MTDAAAQTWTAPYPSSPALHSAAERLGGLRQLDPVAERIAKVVRDTLGSGGVKDLLSGTPLGHPAHPLLTDLPIGMWTSATVLDLVGGRDSRSAADILVALGLAAAAPTAASGWSDWADSTVVSESVRRVGLVHAAANVTAVGFYAASLAARRRGNRGRGKLLAVAGAGALAAGGHLGGHLAYAKGVGVDQTTFEAPPPDWTPAIDAAELDGERTRTVRVDGVELLLGREGERVYALSNRCSHRGGPLDQGEVADGCVTCPWHGSVFRLADGAVMRGPASAPQPTLDVRVRDGRVEVRARAGVPT